jgi:SOS response regulatory protein OraA/RecX
MMKKALAALLLASTLAITTAACEVPEDDGTTAADRADVNSKDDKAGKSKDKADDGPKETKAEENARESAESYLDYTSFSRTGLIRQLKSEGFSTKDATYGVSAQNADWKKQAAASAESYLDYTSFSRTGLIRQLKSEGFTEEQAVYGVNKVGLK